MVRNYTTKLSGQIGENLVVAELGRRGIVATALAGNTPDVDILAYANGKSAAIQVKSIRKGDLSVDAAHYLDIEFNGPKQVVRGVNRSIDRDLLFVVVTIGSGYGDDKFYVLKQGVLQDAILTNHTTFLSRNGGVRPRAPESTHCSIKLSDIAAYQDAWGTIEQAFGITHPSVIHDD